ncbi:plastocyanin/azurin family copper-binding protein [uncultured Shimia sp.]|uniref:plastocyanin/azurin family copper-binding protein n=1 Tax=uncultured Shimia sp. TaxID=573152 RepID=UPI00262E25FD|nr:plastocyanin/azurin family copper-binding protein [uncultured Shimia sp.]
MLRWKHEKDEDFETQHIGRRANGLVSDIAWAASHAETYDIDQLIDLSAMTPEEIYRFAPDYLWIEPGDSIRFLNSTGNHTVTSLEGMWPEGADYIDIEHLPEAKVVLDKPGIYGFRCKVHGRHGMYALVVVGTPEPNIDQIEYGKVSDVGKQIFEKLFAKMEEDWKEK